MGCAGSREKPQPLPSLSRYEWLTWKNRFEAYADHRGIPPINRGEKFVKLIGFLGEEILKKLYFAYTAHETKYEVLLFKFDVYFIFISNGYIAKADNKNLEIYICQLKNLAETLGIEKITETVKEKMLQDFKSQNLFNRLKKLDLHSRISNYENLAIHELLFLWAEYDNLESIQANNFCRSCSLCHPSGRCHALGKKCWQCGGANHFARCCEKKFVTKCFYCGSSHEKAKCPAFTKECSKCKRLNHFSWMCNTEMVNNCTYCGRSHRIGRNFCFAGHSTCMTCSKKGHYTSHCYHRKR